jgi:hypothetical protein
MNRSPFMTEQQAKSFDFSPWGGLEGFLEASKAGLTTNNRAMWLKRVVPDLSHAVDMTATAISSLPFSIMQNGKMVDSSEDWEGKYILADMKRTIYLVASSLCGGAAYLIPKRTPKLVADLQYMVPHSITVQIDRDGLQWFDRATDQGKTERLYPTSKQIIWFWLPDSDVEIGPALNHPLGNATVDAELIMNSKNTMRIYGERGFVPITLLGAKGMPQNAERQKTENFFDRLLKGGFDVLAKIVNADALELIKVGAGMEELKGSYEEILRQSREAVATSFGIPSALFMSDNAFASEFDALTRQWYMASRFKSIYQTIESTFNTQLLKPYELTMSFNLQSLDIFQADESKRSHSLVNIVSAVTSNPAAARVGMGILGYDLTDDQESELDEVATKIETEKEEMRQQEQANQEAKLEQGKLKPKKDPNPSRRDVEQSDAEESDKEKSLSADEMKDLALWYSKAISWGRKGKSAWDWKNKVLREEIAAPIRAKLQKATNEVEIKKAFQIEQSEGMYFAPEIKVIEDFTTALNKALDEIN